MSNSLRTPEAAGQRPKVCIDRILPRDLRRPQRVIKSPRGQTRAIAPIGKSWMNGSVLRVKFIGGTAEQHALVKEQAGWWSNVANLKFEFNNSNNSEIRITFDEND